MMNSKMIQITAGRGPAECCWVVAQVLKVFLEELKMQHFSYTIIKQEAGMENGTVQSVIIAIDGKGVATFLKTWLGTIQWVGTSKFRKFHKRKNWFIGMFSVEDNVTVQFSEKDVSFQTMRSKGPGGQHVNKVNSAVRAIHDATGISVVAMDSRSQHQNKKIALTRLKEKLNEANLEKLKKGVVSQWENHLDLERGNPIRVFKGTDFKKRKTDKTFKNKRSSLKNDLRNELKN